MRDLLKGHRKQPSSEGTKLGPCEQESKQHLFAIIASADGKFPQVRLNISK